MADVEVRDDPEQDRYVATLPGEDDPVGFARYRLDGETIVLDHTVVSPEHEGQGVGSALARGTLDALRDRGAPVLAVCPFMAAYVQRHPEYSAFVQVPDRR